MHDPEARPQRRRQQPGAGRRADQRERLERHLHRPRARPLADHDVELVVLHRRIEDLLDGRAHPVHLVDEQHLARPAGWSASPPGRRPSRSPARRSARIAHAELVGDDVGQRRLAEAGRAVEQHVIERLAALLRRGDRDVQVLADALLADVLVEGARPQPRLVLRVLVAAQRRSRARSSVMASSAPGSSHCRISALQHVAQRLLEAGAGRHRLVERLLGRQPLVAEVEQRRQHIVAQLIRRRAGRQRRLGCRRAPAAGDPSARGRCARRSSCRRRESRSAARRPARASPGSAPPGSMPGQHRQRQLRADAADRRSAARTARCSSARREAVERDDAPRARGCGRAATTSAPGSPRRRTSRAAPARRSRRRRRRRSMRLGALLERACRGDGRSSVAVRPVARAS